MKTLIPTLLLFLLSVLTATASSPSDLAKPILDAIEANNVSNLVSLAIPEGGPMRKYFSNSEIERLNRDFESQFRSLGNSNGYGLLHRSEIKDIYIIEHYILLLDRQPVLLRFDFYKEDAQWRINAFSFNTNLEKHMNTADEWSIGRIGVEQDWEDWERGDLDITVPTKSDEK